MKHLHKDLDQAASLTVPAERAVTVAAILAEALWEIGRDPVLVGGAAVEFYTQGGYSTADIDMVTEGGKDLQLRMKELGFAKVGKDFIDRRRKIYVEFPSAHLKPFERADRILVGNRELKIVSIEDLIVDRLSAFKFWQSAVDGLQAMTLMELGSADEGHLAQRAKEEKVIDALHVLRDIRDQVIRKKLSKSEANRLLESRMRSLSNLTFGFGPLVDTNEV